MKKHPFINFCRSNKLRSLTDVKLCKYKMSPIGLHEFINYKPLCQADSPILPDEESPHGTKEEKAVIKLNPLIIDFTYIETLYHTISDLGWLKLSLEHKRQISASPTKKHQLFIDLDETLIHSYASYKPLACSDEQISKAMYFSKRPFLDIFLQTISKEYDIIVTLLLDFFKWSKILRRRYSGLYRSIWHSNFMFIIKGGL